MNWWKENKLKRWLYVGIAAIIAAAFLWYALMRANTLAGMLAAWLS